ncbi:MAG: STAS domain-containing protein [Bacillota bacterium]|uniref:Anti-sigma factor antagonist n=1 Tax=[Clostridium] aminophilum TaxID=1526 RepID=A0A1I6JTD5_9FIRM|nr:STAS domain-containing protein [[Clostridium] aminophilum]MDT3843102.1 STAS domain-containing protein [Bacillota bacterium]SFR81800.1 anti-sigma B factor antagonist [[Clostridium] aminophilum]
MELEMLKKKEGNQLEILLKGELNTNTAPELKALFEEELDVSGVLILDFEGCDFVSSAGLRVLLSTFKNMKSAHGQMKFLNIGPNFHEVLYITGLDAVFQIK